MAGDFRDFDCAAAAGLLALASFVIPSFDACLPRAGLPAISAGDLPGILDPLPAAGFTSPLARLGEAFLPLAEGVRTSAAAAAATASSVAIFGTAVAGVVLGSALVATPIVVFVDREGVWANMLPSSSTVGLAGLPNDAAAVQGDASAGARAGVGAAGVVIAGACDTVGLRAPTAAEAARLESSPLAAASAAFAV